MRHSTFSDKLAALAPIAVLLVSLFAQPEGALQQALAAAYMVSFFYTILRVWSSDHTKTTKALLFVALPFVGLFLIPGLYFFAWRK